MSEVVSLGKVATVIAGQSPPGRTYNEQGSGLPFFQGKPISESCILLHESGV